HAPGGRGAFGHRGAGCQNENDCCEKLHGGLTLRRAPQGGLTVSIGRIVLRKEGEPGRSRRRELPCVGAEWRMAWRTGPWRHNADLRSRGRPPKGGRTARRRDSARRCVRRRRGKPVAVVPIKF